MVSSENRFRLAKATDPASASKATCLVNPETDYVACFPNWSDSALAPVYRWSGLRPESRQMTNAPADTSSPLSASTNVVRLRRPEVRAHSDEERLRRSRELGGAYPYEMDFSTHTLIAAPGLGTLFGLGPEDEVTYDNVVARIHPDDRPRVKAAHQDALRTGGAYEQEYRIVLPDGGHRWLLARGEVLHDEQGDATGLGGILIDISRRKQAEIALAESEEFTRRLLASSTDCIKVLDLDARLRFMSEGGMQVMEVDDFSRIEGCRWTDFWEGQTAKEAQVAVEAAKVRRHGPVPGLLPNGRRHAEMVGRGGHRDQGGRWQS